MKTFHQDNSQLVNILAGSLIPTPIYMFKAYFLEVCVSITNSPLYMWVLDSRFRCEFILLDSGNACWGCYSGNRQSQTLPALLLPCLARSSTRICEHWRFFISVISPKAAISIQSLTAFMTVVSFVAELRGHLYSII